MTPAGGSTTTTKFAYNGWNSNMPAGTGNANFQQIAILNSDDSLQTRNIDGNMPGQNLARVDESSAPDGGGVYFLLNDYQNSVQAVVDTSGNVKDAITYNAFGTIESETDATYRGWYAWTGMETDQQTGLQYNNGRWYNAATGTWMTQDPLGFDAGDSNLYRYVNNAPTDATDPSGFVEEVEQEGKFAGGTTTLKAKKYIAFELHDLQGNEETAPDYTKLGSLNGSRASGKGVEIKAPYKLENARFLFAEGCDVLIAATIEKNGEKQFKSYYWRQYAQMKTTSDNMTFVKKYTRERGLDPKGAKKWPQIAYEGDSVIMNDIPGVDIPIGTGAAVKTRADGNTVKPLPDGAFGNLTKSFETAFGSTNTIVEMKFETQLIHEAGGAEKIIGTWTWNLKMTWPKKGLEYPFELDITNVKWTLEK